MKATLEFQIPDEREDYTHSYNGTIYAIALTEMDEHLRKVIKYAEPQPKEPLEIFQTRIEAYERIRNEFHEILKDNEINL